MSTWEQQWLYAKAEQMGNFGHWTRNLERDEGSWSDGMFRMFGISKDQFQPSYKFFTSFVHPEDRESIRTTFQAAISNGALFDVEYRIIRPDGIQRFVHSTGEVVKNEEGKPVVLFGIAQDITERKNAELERECLIEDLRYAITKIKGLKPLLPICAYCKKVRNDEDYWEQIESYIHEQTGTSFSHGVCPECLKKVRVEYFGDESK